MSAGPGSGPELPARETYPWMLPLLLAAPWIALLLFAARARMPSELPSARASDGADTRGPLVSVIVPARDEAHNIETCVRSLTSSSYRSFEVIVVDDRSSDRTVEIVAGLGRGRARDLTLVSGTEPSGPWLGKPWACHQGVAVARGELLLFTDADTVHQPALLERAVRGLREDGADLLTVMGRQLMETFWERLVQPQVFFVMLFRFPDVEAAARSPRWRAAIANGQFLLFRREAYAAIGGHEAVRDEVVEDLALAQAVKRAGLRLRVRSAREALSTRMYRSLPELVEGWSKNIVLGGLQTVPRWMRPFVPGLSLLLGVALWVVPPLMLVAGLAGLAGPTVLSWSAVVCATSAVLWGAFTKRMGAPAAYGALYPLGALMGAFIFLRSWLGGRHVTWKGRSYSVPPASERA